MDVRVASTKRDDASKTSLLRSIVSRDEAMALSLINETPSVDVNTSLSNGTTALTLAASAGMLATVKALTAKGADGNAPWHNDETQAAHPLYRAILFKHEAVALFLINEAPAFNLNAIKGNWATALVKAGQMGMMATVKALMAKGAQKNREIWSPDILPRTILLQHEDMATFLVKEVPGVDIFARSTTGSTPLTLAVAEGMLTTVKALVQRGVVAEEEDRDILLYIAIHSNNEAMTSLLLNESSRLQIPTEGPHGIAALMAVTKFGMLDPVKTLVAMGVDANASWSENEHERSSPLYLAVSNKHQAVARFLLQIAGVDVNVKYIGGVSPLMMAAQNGMLSTVKALVARGADIYDRNDSGSTAAHMAACAGHAQTAHWLQFCTLDGEVSDGLRCPIAYSTFEDPVILVADGNTYSRASIEMHFAVCIQDQKPLTSPLTNEIIMPDDATLIPNLAIRRLVETYQQSGML